MNTVAVPPRQDKLPSPSTIKKPKIAFFGIFGIQNFGNECTLQAILHKTAREGILNYCRIKVRFGVVEAVNGNIKVLLRHSRGYRDLNYLLLKAQRLAVTKTQFLVLQKAA
ncbi:MAG: transposase [Terriglobales bacterium]